MNVSTKNNAKSKNNLFGEFIRAARERCGLNATQAGELIKCTRQQVWNMERGDARNPSIETLANLAAAYSLDLGEVAKLAAQCAGGQEYREALERRMTAEREFRAGIAKLPKARVQAGKRKGAVNG